MYRWAMHCRLLPPNILLSRALRNGRRCMIRRIRNTSRRTLGGEYGDSS
jgi:hypothetical protein